VVVKKLRAVLRWTARALLVLLAILVLFILEENIRGHVLLARYEAELRAKGEKLTLAEIDLPMPPAGSNGVPALLAAADEVVTNSKANPLYWYGLNVQIFTSAGRREVLHRQERLPDRRPSSPATSSVGRRPMRGEAKDQPYVPSPPPTCSWDELTKDLAMVSNALESARAAARQPLLGVELDYSRDLDKQFPHLERIRHLREWLSASAMEALHRGNLNTALADITTIVELVRLQNNERIVGVQQGRLSTANLGLQMTWEALQAEGWTQQQLTRLQESWQGAGCLPDYVLSIEMDRARYLRAYGRITFKDTADYWRDQQLDWADLLAYVCSQLGFKSYLSEDQQHQVQEQLHEWVESSMSRALWLVWRVAWVQQDKLHALRRWSINLNATRAVVKEKSWAAWAMKPERRWTFYDQWRYLLYGTSYDCATQIHQAVQYETLREMTVAAIALKRYQLRTGTYPSDLSALVPDFLPALPHDWMDGKPLCYRLNPDGTFTLYSVGDNGVDDGGDPHPPPPRTAFRMWDGRDAVWPAAATQDEVEAWKLKQLQRVTARRRR
jgi:hypothetical protein